MSRFIKKKKVRDTDTAFYVIVYYVIVNIKTLMMSTGQKIIAVISSCKRNGEEMQKTANDPSE